MFTSCSVIVEALKVDSLQRLCSSLEPLFRRIVSCIVIIACWSLYYFQWQVISDCFLCGLLVEWNCDHIVKLHQCNHYCFLLKRLKILSEQWKKKKGQKVRENFPSGAKHYVNIIIVHHRYKSTYNRRPIKNMCSQKAAWVCNPLGREFQIPISLFISTQGSLQTS